MSAQEIRDMIAMEDGTTVGEFLDRLGLRAPGGIVFAIGPHQVSPVVSDASVVNPQGPTSTGDNDSSSLAPDAVNLPITTFKLGSPEFLQHVKEIEEKLHEDAINQPPHRRGLGQKRTQSSIAFGVMPKESDDDDNDQTSAEDDMGHKRSQSATTLGAKSTSAVGAKSTSTDPGNDDNDESVEEEFPSSSTVALIKYEPQTTSNSSITAKDTPGVGGSIELNHVTPENAQEIFLPSACIFVANLVFSPSDEELAKMVGDVFGRFGICWTKVRRDTSGKPFAHVQYRTDSEAKTALEATTNLPPGQEIKIMDRVVRVELCRANRDYFICKRNGTAISKDEVLAFVKPMGPTEKMWKPSDTEAALFELEAGWFVKFSLYSQAKNAVKSLERHPVFKIVDAPMLNKKQARTPGVSATPSRRPLRSDENWLFVGNLKESTTEGRIRDHFSCFGIIAQVQMRKKESKFQGGDVNAFCFIQYQSMQSVSRAASIDGTYTLDGNQLRIKVKQSTTPVSRQSFPQQPSAPSKRSSQQRMYYGTFPNATSANPGRWDDIYDHSPPRVNWERAFYTHASTFPGRGAHTAAYDSQSQGRVHHPTFSPHPQTGPYAHMSSQFARPVSDEHDGNGSNQMIQYNGAQQLGSGEASPHANGHMLPYAGPQLGVGQSPSTNGQMVAHSPHQQGDLGRDAQNTNGQNAGNGRYRGANHQIVITNPGGKSPQYIYEGQPQGNVQPHDGQAYASARLAPRQPAAAHEVAPARWLHAPGQDGVTNDGALVPYVAGGSPCSSWGSSPSIPTPSLTASGSSAESNPDDNISTPNSADSDEKVDQEEDSETEPFPLF